MRFLMTLLLVWATPSAALALNWEGHDEWMTEMPAAIQYDQAHPEAAAKWKLKPCAEPRNAYDQVPLPGRNCTEADRLPKKPPEPTR